MNTEELKESLQSRSGKSFFAFLYLLGVLHWIAFFYLVYPTGGDLSLTKLLDSPTRLFESRSFSAHDWYKEIKYEKVLQEALVTATLPFHVHQLSQLVASFGDRFLATPIWTMSPQVVLLYLLSPMAFSIVNLLLMYSLGFYGCLLLQRAYRLGAVAFAFLFLLFNFNGYFVEKVTAYGPSQLGYFLMPFLVFAIFRASDLKTGVWREQLHWGVLLGIVLAGILYQGSLHLYVECVTFVLIWGLANYKLWPALLASLFVTFTVGAVRLLPAAISFGTGANPHAAIWGGYGHPDWLVQALVVTKTHLSPPVFGWWEFSLYISLVGLFTVVYFGLWGPFMRCTWVRFRGWGVLAIPCLVLVFLSVRQWKQFIIPNWIPLLNAESMTTRYMIIPLLIVVVVAAINLQGFVEKYWEMKRVRYLLVVTLAAIAGFLFNHSRLWRMQRVQTEWNTVISEGLYGQRADASLGWQLYIQNRPGDSLYVYAFWVGLAISCLAVTVSIFCLLRDWRSEPA